MKLGRLTMGCLYVAAGALHFVATKSYMSIMPSYLPAQHLLVLVSGAAEFAGGLGLLLPQTRNAQPGRTAAWGLVALLIAVFPANLTMITEQGRFPGVPLWAAWLRLPLQLPLIWWVWCYTRLALWPQALQVHRTPVQVGDKG